MARYGHYMAIYQLLFFGSLLNLHAASGYIWGHNFWTNQYLNHQNDCLNLSFVKDEYTIGKKLAKTAKRLKYKIVINCESEYTFNIFSTFSEA